jgi:hypothetical protein
VADIHNDRNVVREALRLAREQDDFAEKVFGQLYRQDVDWDPDLAVNDAPSFDLGPRNPYSVMDKWSREHAQLLSPPLRPRGRPEANKCSISTDMFYYHIVNAVMKKENCSFTRACELIGPELGCSYKGIARAYKRNHKRKSFLDKLLKNRQ